MKSVIQNWAVFVLVYDRLQWVYLSELMNKVHRSSEWFHLELKCLSLAVGELVLLYKSSSWPNLSNLILGIVGHPLMLFWEKAERRSVSPRCWWFLGRVRLFWREPCCPSVPGESFQSEWESGWDSLFRRLEQNCHCNGLTTGERGWIWVFMSAKLIELPWEFSNVRGVYLKQFGGFEYQTHRW